jgi:hypothetical protein
MAVMKGSPAEQFDPRSLLELALPPEGRLQLMGDTDDGRGLALVLWHANSGVGGQLSRELVEALYDTLGDWLVDTEPDPDIPGRPV